MKSPLARNAQPTTQPAILRSTASEALAERLRQASAAIARRAYELFEARGSEHGHDREDWFRAESELLIPLPAKVADIDEGFTVRAEVPGLAGVEVRAEPRRLIIHAKKQETSEHEKARAALHGETTDETFCVLDLPHEIDPDNITASIKNEVLEVILPKVNPGKKTTSGVKAA
jgi:HSP20 family molecular chaperone IbpA